MSFRDATALEPIGPGRYGAVIAEGWDIAGNANGGYLLSIMVRAATEATGKPDPRTITGHYLAPGHPGPAVLEVITHRIGGRHATATVTLRVDDHPILRAAPGPGWLRCALATRFITGGYLEADGEIWDGNRLIARSRQLTLVLRVQPEARDR